MASFINAVTTSTSYNRMRQRPSLCVFHPCGSGSYAAAGSIEPRRVPGRLLGGATMNASGTSTSATRTKRPRPKTANCNRAPHREGAVPGQKEELSVVIRNDPVPKLNYETTPSPNRKRQANETTPSPN